jgi:CheY-like chemotaxis protein
MSARSKLLVVDEDPFTHDMLAAALHAKEYAITHCYSGAEALSFLENHPCDLVITDIRMPGLDGLELLRSIQKIRPGTKVLVMTADSTPAVVIRSLRDQAIGYIIKPLSPETVADSVAQALIAPSPQDDIDVVSASPHWISLLLRCKLAIADRLAPFLRELGTDLPAQEREDIGTAFRELLVNAIEHGGRSDPEEFVRVDYIRASRFLIYKVSDPGEGFSFSDLSHAALSNRPEAPYEHLETRERLGLRPGGFGILLTSRLADELIYNEKGNEVLLIKYITPFNNGEVRG